MAGLGGRGRVGAHRRGNRPFVIGPGHDVLDLNDDWVALSEVSERGCVLARTAMVTYYVAGVTAPVLTTRPAPRSPRAAR